MDNKISNVIGVPIPQWLVEQFRVRSKKGAGYDQRDVNELQFLANKTAWVRVVSSVNIGGNDLLHFSKYFASESPFTLSSIEGKLKAGPIKTADSLAKQFILFSGTSKYQKSEDDKSYSHALRSGLSNGSYGMLGEEEVNRYGYLPMPGITSVTIETMGRMGSVRSATINFKVFDKLQLDIIDALYFKLGYTMLLEWGHTYYYETPPAQVAFGNFSAASYLSSYRPQLKSTEDLMIDPFAPNLTKEKVNYQIALNLKKSYGNYDGMLGVVTNFNFSRKEDGSYDCTVKLIGLGAIAESLKINRSNVFTNILEDEVKKIVESENVKRQAQANELNGENRAKLEQLKAELSAIKAQKEQAKTINEIFQEKIDNRNKNLPLRDQEKLIDYLYTPSGNELNLYNEKFADVVYDPEKTWAIRRLGFIIDNNTKIKKVTLYSDVLKAILNKSEFINKEGYTGLKPFTSFSENVFSYDTLTLHTTNQHLYYDFLYRRNNDGVIYVESSLKKVKKYNAYRYFTVILEDLNPSILGISVPSIRDIAIRLSSGIDISSEVVKVYKNKAYDEIINNPIFEDVTLHFYEVELASLTEKEINDAPYTNKVNTNKRIRYIPILQLKKSIILSPGAAPVSLQVIISDSAFIQNIEIDKPELQNSKEFLEKNQKIQDENNKKTSEILAKEAEIKRVEQSIAKIEISAAQKEEVNKFPSALENALRAIQLYSYNRASNTTSVQKIDFTSDNNKLINAIFKPVGLYSFLDTFESKIINGDIPNIPNYGNVPIEDKNDVELLEFYIKYGFNVSIMANVHSTLINTDPLKDVKPVNHKDLLCSYVIPYEVSQDLSQGIKLERPVYIQLGTLLMLINHLALMYDSKEDSQKFKRPLFYVDYNPNTNFCLTSLNHLSTNPFNFMIPYSGTKEDFKKLFDTSLLSGEFVDALFDPVKNNRYSLSLPEFLTGTKDKDVYRGKLMSVLIDVDYLLSTIRRYSDANNTNSIYFKSFVDNLLSDMCKALGNYNLLRLAYNDAANCFYIVDDQIVPAALGEDFASRTTTNAETYEIPLYGNTSIAKSLEIKTDISSRLSNMIAISANSEKYQSEMANDSTSFGFINKNFKDRYIPLRTDIVTQKQKEESDSNITQGDKDAAKKFNDAIIQYYGVIDVTMDSVNSTTNYYISRMAKVKAENSASRASAIIPVSVNFTTDGISGFNMYQSFGINEELLPYTYTAKNPVDDQPVQRRVGFCVVGLSHTIDNNQWNTSVKSNMIFLKDYVDYRGDKAQYKPKTQEGERRNPKLPEVISVSTGGGGKKGGGCQRRSVTTKNFRQLYPNAIPTIKSGNSNIPLSNLGLRPLSESEIIDDTSKNLFDCGVYKKIPTYFIIHHTAGGGSPQGVYNTFAARGFPAHYVIDKQGKIYRYLPDGLIGAHVSQANSIAMGVEIIANNDRDVSKIQTDAAIKLAHYLGFNADRVLGHGKVSDNKESTEGYSTVIRINPNYKPGYDRYAFTAYEPGKILPISFKNA